MGESDRYSEYGKPRKRLTLGDDGNALVGLVTLNIIFFLLLMVIKVVYNNFDHNSDLFLKQAVHYFTLPAQLSTLAERPWTIITYMFSDIDMMRAVSNMLWLWAFGFILQQLTGNRKLIPIYIYGGLAGAVVFVAVNYAMPSLRPAVGSAWLMGGNAATMAIATATTFLAPNFRFFQQLNGGIPIWILTLVYILIDFASFASMGSAVSMAHLGGAGAGILFIYLLRKGYDGSLWMNSFYHWFMNLFNPDKRKKNEDIREKVFYNAEGRKPYKKTSNVTQQRVDEILDKINQKGYHFLTDEEKNILKRAADEDLK